jgi:SNF2 family DNA or RNA helicase
VLTASLSGRFAIEPDLAEWLAWIARPLPPLPPHRALVAAAAPGEDLPDGRRLFAHQRLAVRWLLARRGAVLADAMGLGKTLSALVAARGLVRLADCRVVVLAPVGLHHHWRQEALSLGLHLELHSWACLPAGLPPAGCVVIADEAHYAQNLAAHRTQAFLRLARHPRLRALWLLTGTPMKNGRPRQLFPLLAAIGHPIAADQHRFEARYGLGHWIERGAQRRWQADGAAHLEELHRLCRPLVLHRRKQDCLDLPPKRRELLPVTLSAAAARGFDHRISQQLETYRRRAARGEVSRDAEALAMLTALRQIASDAKLPAAASLLEQCLDAGEPVVLFTAFVATAERLHARFGGSLLTGRLRPCRRQGEVDAFQRGQTSLLLATYGTGGLGFTLTRARHVVLLERPWTPGDAEQAEDRCHRIGMAQPLQCHWLQLGVADQLVDGLIASKAERIALLFEGRRALLERQRLPQMVRQLAARLAGS